MKNGNFGMAIEEMKAGRSVWREGWNGKGMLIYINQGSQDASLPRGETIEGIDARFFENGDTGTVTRLPNINMKNAAGSTVTGWLASQVDMLAEDWCSDRVY